MFIHNLKYTVKILFKNKVLIFWMFAFPIILGIFFHMAFENIEKDEALQVFDIAVIDLSLIHIYPMPVWLLVLTTIQSLL